MALVLGFALFFAGQDRARCISPFGPDNWTVIVRISSAEGASMLRKCSLIGQLGRRRPRAPRRRFLVIFFSFFSFAVKHTSRLTPSLLCLLQQQQQKRRSPRKRRARSPRRKTGSGAQMQTAAGTRGASLGAIAAAAVATAATQVTSTRRLRRRSPRPRQQELLLRVRGSPLLRAPPRRLHSTGPPLPRVRRR